MKEIVKYSHCFVCGDKHEHGLKAKFYFDGTKAITEIVASKEFEGYRGIYHGGIISSLLDEVMIKAILAQDKYVVTAEMTVRFVAPVRVGERVRLTGEIIKNKGRIFHAIGEAKGPDGQVYATATGKYIEARPELKEILMQIDD
ncbi:MAG: PaaI family thioesterase [candidate division Zixibacteria bacterium]|nr:PaaI family thioesterase [candidate division Zixibacteria bacterium]